MSAVSNDIHGSEHITSVIEDDIAVIRMNWNRLTVNQREFLVVIERLLKVVRELCE